MPDSRRRSRAIPNERSYSRQAPAAKRQRCFFAMNSTVAELEMVDDRSLLARVRAGDIEGFSEVCRSHETRLVRQAMVLCGNQSQAEELAQETFVEAWKSLRRYHGRCQFFTWLCAILLNRYRNVRREKRPIPFASLATDDQDR